MRYTVELTKHLCKKHEVHLITKKYEYKIPNLIVHKFPALRGPPTAQIFADVVYATECLQRLEKNFDFDVVHCAAANVVADIVTAHNCHRASIKTWNKTSRRECSYPKYLFYKIARELLPVNRAILMFEKRRLQRCKKIIAVSKLIKQEILANYDVPDEKIVVIPNGVNLEDFKPDKEKRLRVRQMLDIDENEVVLIFVGIEFKRKGLTHLIEAMPHVDAKLIVVGKDDSAPYRSLAERLEVNSKIIFTGTVPKVEDYYAASDIFVFPTQDEPFGLVIMEAMASGIPVIISKCAGATTLMKDGYDCLLLNDPANSTEIAEKINSLIKDENLRKRMGGNARKTAKEYSWDKTAEKTLKVYEEVIGD